MFRSSNPDYSLGIYVIIDCKKSMLSPTKYLVRGQSSSDADPSVERWTLLKRGLDKAGKPFRLLRKVL